MSRPAPRSPNSSAAWLRPGGVAAAEVRVAVQDRPRNERFVAEARAAGASVELFEHGDVERCIRAARGGGGLDIVAGIGGAPEGVLTAAAVRALGGSMHARLAPQSDGRGLADRGSGAVGRPRLFGLDDLCGADAWLFVAAVTPVLVRPGCRVRAGGVVARRSGRSGIATAGPRRSDRILKIQRSFIVRDREYPLPTDGRLPRLEPGDRPLSPTSTRSITRVPEDPRW